MRASRAMCPGPEIESVTMSPNEPSGRPPAGGEKRGEDGPAGLYRDGACTSTGRICHVDRRAAGIWWSSRRIGLEFGLCCARTKYLGLHCITLTRAAEYCTTTSLTLGRYSTMSSKLDLPRRTFYCYVWCTHGVQVLARPRAYDFVFRPWYSTEYFDRLSAELSSAAR